MTSVSSISRRTCASVHVDCINTRSVVLARIADTFVNIWMYTHTTQTMNTIWNYDTDQNFRSWSSSLKHVLCLNYFFSTFSCSYQIWILSAQYGTWLLYIHRIFSVETRKLELSIRSILAIFLESAAWDLTLGSDISQETGVCVHGYTVDKIILFCFDLRVFEWHYKKLMWSK